jgi:hypothetical protein
MPLINPQQLGIENAAWAMLLCTDDIYREVVSGYLQKGSRQFLSEPQGWYEWMMLWFVPSQVRAYRSKADIWRKRDLAAAMATSMPEDIRGAIMDDVNQEYLSQLNKVDSPTD